MFRVHCYEVFQEEEMALRAFLPPEWDVTMTSLTIQEVGESAPPAPVISLRTQSIIPSSWAKDLKAVLTRSRGADHLVRFLNEVPSPVVCGHLPPYCSRAVAEQAFLAALALVRRWKKQVAQMASFSRDGLTGRELGGKRALILGVGEIGYQCAKLAAAWGMTVKGVDVDPRHSDVEYVSGEEGVSWGDVIFCCLPLTSTTRGWLSYDRLKNGPPGRILVNIGRGEISPLADMKRLLDEGRLAGLAMDVFERESELGPALRRAADLDGTLTPAVSLIQELSVRDNVMFTPHNAFNTVEALENKARATAESLISFLSRGVFPYPVEGEGKSGC